MVEFAHFNCSIDDSDQIFYKSFNSDWMIFLKRKTIFDTFKTASNNDLNAIRTFQNWKNVVLKL